MILPCAVALAAAAAILIIAAVAFAHTADAAEPVATGSPGGILWSGASGYTNTSCRTHQWRAAIFEDLQFTRRVGAECFDYNPLDPCGSDAELTDCWCPEQLSSCERFSATFSTSADIAGDRVHAFLVDADDEAHVFVGGHLAFSTTCGGGPCADRVFALALAAGRHDLNVRYVNQGGGAHVFLRWQPIRAEEVDFGSGPVLRQGQQSASGVAEFYTFSAASGETYRASLQLAEMTGARLVLFNSEWEPVSMAKVEGDQTTAHLVWTCASSGTFSVGALAGPRAPRRPVGLLTSIELEADPCTEEGALLAGPGGVLDFSSSSSVDCKWLLRCREGFLASLIIADGEGGSASLAAYSGAIVSTQASIAGTENGSATVLRSTNNQMLLQYHRDAAAGGPRGFAGSYRCTEAGYLDVPVDGSPVGGTIVSAGDRGAFRFRAVGGTMYRIEVVRQSLPRCILQIFHADGETQLAMLEDRGGRAASVEWLCPLSEEYTFTVSPFREEHTGRYAVSVATLADPCSQTVELTSSTGVLVFSNKYSSPASCDWTVRCHEGETANLFFAGFQTTRGIVDLFDGQGTASEPIASLSGPLGTSAGSFESEHECITLAYSSESLAREQFEVEYRCDSPVFQIQDCVSGQFLVQYYANTRFSGSSPVAVCSEPKIDFNWGLDGVDLLSGQVDNFSVRWTGSLSFENANYVFFSRSDDGSRAYVDDAIVLDHLEDCCATWHSEAIGLMAGQHEVRYEFVEYGAEAYCALNWVQTSRSEDVACSEDVCHNGGNCLEVVVPATSYPATMTAYTLEVTQNFSRAILDRSNPARKVLEDSLTRTYADLMQVPTADVVVMTVRGYPSESAPVDTTSSRPMYSVPITIEFAVLCTPVCPFDMSPTTVMQMPPHTSASCDCARGFTGSRCGIQACEGRSITLDMRDLHGDGWNGNTLEVREAGGSVVVRGVTLGGGPTASTELCLPSDGTCLHVSVGGGGKREEVTWTMYDRDRNAVLRGGAPFEGRLGCR